MNAFAGQCQVEDILLEVDIQSSRQLFAVVAQHLYQWHGLNENAIANHLSQREKMGSTGLGQGVAIPHARVGDLQSPLIVFVRTKLPILFAAPDGKPVGDFFVLLVPQHATQEHLQLLAEAASLLCEREFRETVRDATTPMEIRRLLMSWSKS